MTTATTPYRLEPSWKASGVLLAGVAVAWLALSGETPSHLASRPAWLLGIALLGAFVIEFFERGPQQMIRVDNAALAAAYYLTLFEFLIPQPLFDEQATVSATRRALQLILLGFLGLALGRHLVPIPRKARRAHLPGATPRELAILLGICFLLGHAYMFATVQFHPVKLVEGMLSPRMEQPWGRERLGDWRALLSELKLLTYLVPPITALLLVRVRGTRPWLFVTVCLLAGFEFLAAFTSGTRYVFATHLATFTAAMLLSLDDLRPRRALILFGTVAALLLAFTFGAVQFRKRGLSGLDTPAHPGHRQGLRLVVDNNLRTIAALTEHFPDQSPFLGVEVLHHVLIRPVPRALWPEKPEKLSVSMEDIVQIPETTIASSFVGEGYMAFGWKGTLGFGLALGVLLSLWNRILSSRRHHCDLILYVSGFVWALLAMRSPIWISIGLLPAAAFGIAMGFAFPLARRWARR